MKEQERLFCLLRGGKLRIKFCFNLRKFEVSVRHLRRNVSRRFEMRAWSSVEGLELEKYIWTSSAWTVFHQFQKHFLTSQRSGCIFSDWCQPGSNHDIVVICCFCVCIGRLPESDFVEWMSAAWEKFLETILERCFKFQKPNDVEEEGREVVNHTCYGLFLKQEPKVG